MAASASDILQAGSAAHSETMTFDLCEWVSVCVGGEDFRKGASKARHGLLFEFYNGKSTLKYMSLYI